MWNFNRLLQPHQQVSAIIFKDAGIYKAINDAQEIFERVESPFRAQKLVVKSCLMFILFV